MRQRRRHARSLQHHARLAEADAVYDSTVAIEQTSAPPSPRSQQSPSPHPPSTPPTPAVARTVSRRLTMAQPQAAQIAAESPPLLDPATPNPVSPTIHCSQFRVHQYQMQNGPSLPTAVSASTLPDSRHLSAHDGAQGAKFFLRGQLHIHKAYTGPEPVGYVDTGLYEGGQDDWYEAYSEGDVLWARRLDYVLRRHNIPRWRSRR